MKWVEHSPISFAGFEVYGPKLFYPVTWLNAADYFEEKELDVELPYTYHVWNKFTASYKVNSNSVYAKIAQKYCPEVYEMFGENFGLWFFNIYLKTVFHFCALSCVYSRFRLKTKSKVETFLINFRKENIFYRKTLDYYKGEWRYDFLKLM